MTALDLTAFEPDPERGRALDARMQKGLAESLAHLAEEAGPQGHVRADALARPVALIEAGHAMPPEAFGWYYELAFALLADRSAEAAAPAEALSRISPATGGLTVRDLADPAGDATDAMLLRRMGDTGSMRFEPPPEPRAGTFAADLEAARAILRTACPALDGEIAAILREVVLITGHDPGTDRDFDGASAYQLWGLLFINPMRQRSAIELAEVLAHEAGHSTLFGMTYDEPLALNPDGELFPSPLRVDPRPMDGIFHATFVSARMHWAMRRVAECGEIAMADRELAARSAEHDARAFRAGLGVIEAHGRLTETGRRAIDAAKGYMNVAA